MKYYGKIYIKKRIRAIALKMAKIGCGAASVFGTYQPKEPEALKKMMKKK